MQLVLTKIGSDRPLSPKEKQNLILPARALRRLRARRPDSARLLGAGLCVDGTVTSKRRGEGGGRFWRFCCLMLRQPEKSFLDPG